MLATMLRASRFASRTAFWAVGAWNEPGFCTSGISAQSPIAHTPARLVAIVASVTARPALSTSIPDARTTGDGCTPPVQMTVRDGMKVPSPMTTPSSRTSFIGVLEVDLVASLAQPLGGVRAHVGRHLGQDAVLELDDVATRSRPCRSWGRSGAEPGG